MISTQAELRQEFWRTHKHLKPKSIKMGPGYYRKAKQNEYPADTRMAWCDFVEHMRRSGDITERLAERATL